MDQGRIVFDDSPEQVFKCWREVNRLGIRLPQVTEFFGKLFGNQSITRKLPVTLEQAKVLADDYLREEESVR
jgi:hypothetical protein